MQERGRKGAVTRGGEAAFSELQGWMTAAKKVGIQAALTEIDTNGNGTASAADGDLTNAALAAAGVVATWLAPANLVVAAQTSPWGVGPLWVNGGIAASQAACDAASLALPGQITICFNPADDATIQAIFLSARDNIAPPNLIYQKTISAD